MEIESIIKSSRNDKFEEAESTTVQEILNDSLTQDMLGQRFQFSLPTTTAINILTENLILTSASNITRDLIDSLNITCVINCAPELPDFHLRGEDILYHRVEVQDRPSENILRFFEDAADLIEEVAQSGGKTLVFCVAGVSRSASICLAYLMKYHNRSLLESYNYVKSRRPRIRPNCGFFMQLIEFEKRLFNVTSVMMVFNEFVQMDIPNVYDSEYRFVKRFDRKKKDRV